MLQERKYTVKPSGIIKGGTAAYSAGLNGGKITYAGSVKVQFLWFSKTVTAGGTYKVDPKLLLTSGIKTVGQSMTIGPAQFKITAIDKTKKQATASLKIATQPTFKGKIVFDLSKQHLDILSLVETGTIQGFDFDLELTRVNS